MRHDSNLGRKLDSLLLQPHREDEEPSAGTMEEAEGPMDFILCHVDLMKGLIGRYCGDF